MKGTDIKNIGTINSQYANGYLNVTTKDDSTKRIHVTAILEMAKHFEFREKEARQYTHLVGPILLKEKINKNFVFNLQKKEK